MMRITMHTNVKRAGLPARVGMVRKGELFYGGKKAPHKRPAGS